VTSDDVIRPLVNEGAFACLNSSLRFAQRKGPLACEGADDAKGVTGVRHPQDDSAKRFLSPKISIHLFFYTFT